MFPILETFIASVEPATVNAVFHVVPFVANVAMLAGVEFSSITDWTHPLEIIPRTVRAQPCATTHFARAIILVQFIHGTQTNCASFLVGHILEQLKRVCL